MLVIASLFSCDRWVFAYEVGIQSGGAVIQPKFRQPG